ncbi:hypothetical protein P607_23970 [Comamonas thiooxydans]|nr:hypothetical protein P607_23970 [Comamonas thiooxydans]
MSEVGSWTFSKRKLSFKVPSYGFLAHVHTLAFNLKSERHDEYMLRPQPSADVEAVVQASPI